MLRVILPFAKSPRLFFRLDSRHFSVIAYVRLLVSWVLSVPRQVGRLRRIRIDVGARGESAPRVR